MSAPGLIDTTALIDAVQFLNVSLKDRTGEGLYAEQLQVIFDFTSDGTERWDMLNDIGDRIGGAGSVLREAVIDVLSCFEPIDEESQS
jgi:hypothetical protein